MIDKVFNNRYRLTDRIGLGGMAEVYRAYDEVLGRAVAVKIMLPQYATDPSFLQRFRQEAAAAANLQSPYIVNVYDWGQDESVSYIVMEYVRGSDLKTAINERGCVNQHKVAEIGSQVCQALSVAHNLDIIHRDIKPQNIMIQPDGNVKVMDFGIARAKNSLMTQTPSVLGTAHYISPEQAQGKDLTPASDIYSLGIVLYEAATGVLPFDAPDAVSVAMQQVSDLPIPPHEYNPDIDPDFEDIIMKALAKRPTDRFVTANDMRLALNDYLAGRPVDLGIGFAQAETAILGGMPGVGIVGSAAGGMANGVSDGTAVMPSLMKPVSQTVAPTNYRAASTNREDGSHKKTIGIIVAIIAAILIIGGIVFFISQGTGEPVPNVTNLSLEAATQKIREAGFDVGVTTEEPSLDVEAGKVIRQTPKAGDKAKPGTKVDLVVSIGPKDVRVPDLTNKSSDEARKILEELGLKGVSGQAEYSDTIPITQVVRQDPEAGQTVKEGSTVTYYLSLGIEGADIPNVVGLTEAAARERLEAEGFKLGNVRPAYSDDLEEGLITEQNPKAGTSTKKGATVDVVISRGVDPEKLKVTVPNFVNETESSARAKAAADGFILVVDTAYSADVAKGRVIRQEPTAGTRLDKGSEIKIVVSDGPNPSPPGGSGGSGSGG